MYAECVFSFRQVFQEKMPGFVRGRADVGSLQQYGHEGEMFTGFFQDNVSGDMGVRGFLHGVFFISPTVKGWEK